MLYIETLKRVKDYEEAIYLSCERLCRHGLIEKRYYHAILNIIDEYGGYFYLGNGICMPHARMEEGVIHSGMCLVKLKKPVDFYGHSVRVFFTIAAKNDECHFEQMKKIAEVCMEKELLQQLMETDDEQELYKILGGRA